MADEQIYVIWWTNQTDCELLQAICETESGGTHSVPQDWPEWLCGQWSRRLGRNGRGRLWNAFSAWLPDVIAVWPENAMTKLLGGESPVQSKGDRHSAAGIVVPLGDLHHVIGLPGFVTNDTVTRLWVHGVDIDL